MFGEVDGMTQTAFGAWIDPHGGYHPLDLEQEHARWMDAYQSRLWPWDWSTHPIAGMSQAEARDWAVDNGWINISHNAGWLQVGAKLPIAKRQMPALEASVLGYVPDLIIVNVVNEFDDWRAVRRFLNQGPSPTHRLTPPIIDRLDGDYS